MNTPAHISEMIGLIHRNDLAIIVGYSGANSSFTNWCAKMRITPVPGRAGYYDPHLVRRRFDEAQGLRDFTVGTNAASPISLVDQRKARNGTA